MAQMGIKGDGEVWGCKAQVFIPAPVNYFGSAQHTLQSGYSMRYGSHLKTLILTHACSLLSNSLIPLTPKFSGKYPRSPLLLLGGSHPSLWASTQHLRERVVRYILLMGHSVFLPLHVCVCVKSRVKSNPALFYTHTHTFIAYI